MITSLRDWISDETEDIELLPVCHTTKWEDFEKIIESGILSSKYSKFLSNPVGEAGEFSIDLVYLFYGLPFYIYETGEGDEIHIEATDQLPIVMIFNPLMISRFDCFYPFDTGALLSGKFKKIMNNQSKEELEVYRVDISTGSELQRTVKRYYRKNENYCFGKLKFDKGSSRHPNEEKLIRLFEQSASTELDIRSRAIEVHCTEDLVLSESIRAIVLPRMRSNQYKYLIKNIETKFPDIDIIFYNDMVRFNHESIRTAVINKTMDFYDSNTLMAFSYAEL